MQPVIEKFDHKANLFIVGGVNCGVNILHDVLCENNEIYGHQKRKIDYFTLNRFMGERWYDQHFVDGRNAKYRMDASSSYFDTSINNAVALDINAYAPDGKVIAILRDPVERVLFHFAHLKNIVGEPCLKNVTEEDFFGRDFVEAFSGSTEIDYILRNLLSVSLYSRKLMYFSSVFGRDRFLLLHIDDLMEDTVWVMSKTFDFLGLDSMDNSVEHKRNYIQETKKSILSVNLQEKLSKFFSEDYYESCNFSGGTRIDNKDSSKLFYTPNGSMSGEAIVGRDGWLFIAKGSNDVLEYYYDNTSFTDASMDDWRALLERRRLNLSESGAKYLHIIIPEKITIYDHKFPLSIDWKNGPGQRFYENIPVDLRNAVVNLIPEMRARRDKIQLYWRTDSHWNFEGAFLAYLMICSHLGTPPQSRILDIPPQTVEWEFDLASKFRDWPQESGIIREIKCTSEVIEENELVKFKRLNGLDNAPGLHVGCMVKFCNNEAMDSRRVMLFGDSYSEYRRNSLTAMLAETFSQVIFVWSSNIDYNLIRSEKPDIVMTAMTERFMRYIPSDDFDVVSFSKGVLDKYIAQTENSPAGLPLSIT